MSLSSEVVLEEVLKNKLVQNLKVTTNYSIKYGTIVGTAAIVSGLLGGPIGLAAGGILSSVIIGRYTYNKFSSIPYVIYHDMTSEQREMISKELFKFITMKNIKTLFDLTTSLHNGSPFAEQIVEILIMYLFSQFDIKVVQKQ